MECKNCNTSLSKLINYCPLCGAKIIKKRLTFKNLSADITEQFLNIDNKFLKTFIHLFTQPETVINGFINGTRKKYINVIQYFAVGLTLVGLQVFLMNTFFAEAMELDPDMFGAMADPELQKNNPFNNIDYAQINNFQSIIYIISVPIATIATWTSYYILGIRHFNFTEHLVINLYYSGQVIIISGVLSIIFLCFGIDFMLISGVITLLTFGYFLYVLKRVFHASFWDAVLQFIVIMFAYLIIFVILMIITFIVGVAYAYLNK